MKYLSNIDLNSNQLQNARLHPIGTAPATPGEGQIYFNSSVGDKKMYYYNGTSWVTLTSDTDNYTDSLSFNSSTGVLTLGQTGSIIDLTASLDGRYLTQHPTILAASSVDNSGRTYIQDITLDSNGHVTGIVSATETVTDTTYLAGTGLTLTGNTFNHTNSITAGSFGDGGITRTLSYGGTFNIPTVNYNSEGHITSKSSIALTLPSTPAAYTASGGITLTSQNFAHTNTITASNFGDAGTTRTLAFGGTFAVPYVTYDAYGHIATKSNLTLTLPSNIDTNWYPTTFAWSAGTSAGPTGSLTGVGMSAVSYGAIPSASGTNSGIVTNAVQTFAGDKTFSNNVIVTGNLTVNGTVTTINTETINIADNLITLNSNYTGPTPTENGGIEIERGTLANSSLIWNETTDKWQVSADSITFYDIVTSAQSFSTSVGNGILTSIPVTHNLGTRDVIVQLFDMSSYDTVFADVIRTDANTVTLLFAVAPTTNDIRVLVTKIGSSIT